MTVDEILAKGHYTDRRGREWRNITHWNVESWAAEPYGKPDILPEEMRLLIERDMHRDECAGLWGCVIHPVIHVYQEHGERGDEWVVHEPDNPTDRWGRETHQQAINVAYRLAVANE